MLAVSDKLRNFAAEKVRLAAINWDAITRLSEKAFRGGVKSEDQPFR